MEVLIHIGFPKTGSTAIQAHLFSNARWFSQKGLYIPKAGYASGFGHAFLLPHDEEKHPQKGPGSMVHGAGELSQLSQELAIAERSGFTRALISWEGFSSTSLKLIQLLGNALGNHTVCLLAYVREQSELLQSAILQGMENIHSLVDPKLFRGVGEDFNIHSNLDFHAVLKDWEHAFKGQLDIRVRLYSVKILKE